MRNRKNKTGHSIAVYFFKKVIAVLLVTIAIISCRNNEKQKPVAALHDALLSKPDGSSVYIDAIPNSAVMKNAREDTGATRFYSFRIGFIDSLIADKKAEMMMQRYYDFEMEKYWVALMKGDSLWPVFFHPQVQKSPGLKEFVIVFEAPAESRPDTFIYKDKFRREINTIVLKRK